MQWGEPAPLYGPWDTSEVKPGWRIEEFDATLRGIYGPALRDQLMRQSPFARALQREMLGAEDDIESSMSDQMFGPSTIKLVTDPLCPPNKAFLLDTENMAIFKPEIRRRFWYKPWTWRRKNGYAPPFKWNYHTVRVSAQAKEFTGLGGMTPDIVTEDEAFEFKTYPTMRFERHPIQWFHDHYHWRHDEDGNELGGEG